MVGRTRHSPKTVDAYLVPLQRFSQKPSNILIQAVRDIESFRPPEKVSARDALHFDWITEHESQRQFDIGQVIIAQEFRQFASDEVEQLKRSLL